MSEACLETEAIAYRNFNHCPHRILLGEQALLCRVKRRPAHDFALKRQDLSHTPRRSPPSLPNERSSGSKDRVSVCFWYSRTGDMRTTSSAVVILPTSRTNHSSFFRLVEAVADLLAQELLRTGKLATFYEFFEDLIREVAACGEWGTHSKSSSTSSM